MANASAGGVHGLPRGCWSWARSPGARRPLPSLPSPEPHLTWRSIASGQAQSKHTAREAGDNSRTGLRGAAGLCLRADTVCAEGLGGSQARSPVLAARGKHNAHCVPAEAAACCRAQGFGCSRTSPIHGAGQSLVNMLTPDSVSSKRNPGRFLQRMAVLLLGLSAGLLRAHAENGPFSGACPLTCTLQCKQWLQVWLARSRFGKNWRSQSKPWVQTPQRVPGRPGEPGDLSLWGRGHEPAPSCCWRTCWESREGWAPAGGRALGRGLEPGLPLPTAQAGAGAAVRPLTPLMSRFHMLCLPNGCPRTGTADAGLALQKHSAESCPQQVRG